MNSREIVRAQNPAPETVGIYHGDRGIETQKNRWLNKPRYVEISKYAGPGGTEQVRYRNMAHMPVDANGNSVDPLATGAAGGYCNGNCGNGDCNGNCGNGDCNGDCNDGSCLSGQYNPGGCGYAVRRYLHDGYPTHVHKFSYYPPKGLTYPPPNVPAAVVQYPYYTVKGPDDFFYPPLNP